MSYILDALKKAERERQRGAVPTIHVDMTEPEMVRRAPYGWYATAAMVVLGAGILIGTYRPFGHPPVPATATLPGAQVAVAPVVSAPAAPVARQQPIQPPPAPPAKPSAPVSQVAISAPPPRPVESSAPTPVASPKPAPVPESKPADAVEGQPWLLADLPLNIQQEIPALNVMFHAYSQDPTQRLVEVNGKPMHEGDLLVAGLKLERIMQDGMVFSYKGYRFKTGVR